jgi:hypothetical protein
MNEPEKPLSNQKLLERFIKLESENAALLTRIVKLEKRATNNDEDFIRLTQQVGGVLQNVGLIDMQVLELMAKVFPDYIRSQGQIAQIFTSTNWPGQTKSDLTD